MSISEDTLLGKTHKRQIYVRSSKLCQENWCVIADKVSFYKTI